MYGEYRDPAAESVSAEPSAERDVVFRDITTALFTWLRAGVFYSDGMISFNRNATFLCTGWVDGLNFRLTSTVDEGNLLIVNWHSLLPTSHMKEERSTLGNVVNARFEAKDYLLRRLRRSLGKAMSLSVEQPTTTSRVITFAAGRMSVMPISLTKNIGEKKKTVEKNSIRVIDGPNIARVGIDNATIAVEATGHGTVDCYLFEVPVHMNISDLRAIIGISSERDAIFHQLRGHQRKSVRGFKRQMLFRFFGLKPYCCFGIAVGLDSSKEIALVSHFRTFELKNAPISCLLLSSLNRKP